MNLFGMSLVAVVALVINFAFWAGLVFFAFWCANHFGLI